MSKIIEGNLPLIVENQNTEKIKNYQIYGTADGAGAQTENLWDGDVAVAWLQVQGESVRYRTTGNNSTSICIPCLPLTTYSIKKFSNANRLVIGVFGSKPINDGDSGQLLFSSTTSTEATITTLSNSAYIVFYIHNVLSYDEKATVVKSDTAPSTYIPYGYKLPMTVTSGETENLIDSNAVQMLPNARYGVTISTPGTYTITAFNNVSAYIYARTYNADNEPISDNQSVVSSTGSITTRTLSISDGEYIAVFDPTTSATMASTINKFNTDKIIAIKGSTPPDHYIPYRYSITTPIYIGDTELGAEEYVDYGEQKIYRRTENLFNKDTVDSRTQVALGNNGSIIATPGYWTISDYIPVSAGTYTAFDLSKTGQGVYCCIYNSDKEFIRSQSITPNTPVTLNIISGESFVKLSVRLGNNEINDAMFIMGSTRPEIYVPYLNPTNLPVALPTISLYKGTNTLSSTTELSKVILDYSVPEISRIQLENQLYDLIDGNFYNIIANSYSSSLTYNEGDYCIYNYQLYKCISAISIPEDFDSEKWSQVTLTESL